MVADTVASGLTSSSMPAEMISPYVPVSGPALGEAVDELEAFTVALAEGEANGLGDLDPLVPPPHEINKTGANVQTAPLRIKGDLKAANLYVASFLPPVWAGHD